MVNRRRALLGAGAAMAAAAPALGQSVKAPPVAKAHAKFAAEIGAAQACLDAFMTAFNARDLPAFASGKVTTILPGDMKPAMFTTGSLAEWDHSAWQRRSVIHAGADKVHIDTHFARYRKDGSLIGGFDSIYIVTKLDGRWGILGRSSYAPSVLPFPRNAGVGDHRPKSRWWRGKASSSADRSVAQGLSSQIGEAGEEAFPLHHPLFAALGGRSPSPAARERKGAATSG